MNTKDLSCVEQSFFDRSGRKTSFETSCNTTTHSFQWEPDVVTLDAGTLMAVWSSWGQTGEDYEIVGRVVTPSHS